MFNVTLYQNFAKPYNSTKIPSDGENFPCLIVEPSGIINANISFNQGVAWNPSAYNYAYIEDWKRYYYITEWSFDSGRWYATLQCDVMASWKTEILSASEYIVRSATEFDLSVIDMLYPATTNYSIESVQFPLFDANTIQDGIFVVAIANGKSGSVSGITYYVATFNEMVELFSFLYENTDWLNGPDIDDISNDLLKCLVNPAQFISSVMWFPMSLDIVDLSGSTKVGAAWWETDMYLPTIAGSVTVQEKLGRFRHPQESRGTYLNYAPYTSMKLYVPAFGTFELNLDKFPTSSLINIDIQIDMVTGQGTLFVYPSGKGVGAGQQITAQVGVSVAITSMQSDILGALTSVGSAVGQATNITSGIFGTIGAVGDAAKMISPDVSVIGSTGNMSVYKNNGCLVAVFKNLVEEDLQHHGRPLFKKRVLGSLSGFTQVRDFDTNLPCTLPEQQEIKSIAEGGFFIE